MVLPKKYGSPFVASQQLPGELKSKKREQMFKPE